MSRPLSFNLDKAIKLFKKYPSWSMVAKKMGVSRGSIMNALRPLGYKTEAKRGQPRTWDVEEALRLKTEEEMSIEDIAVRMGMSRRTIYDGLQKLRESRKCD